MDLFRLKAKKRLEWPHELTPVPAELSRRLNPSGRQNYRLMNRVARSEEPGFVVDVDSPGESFFLRDEALRLERVPADEVEEAAAKLKAQGPITWQPALDWLEAQGLRQKAARPAEVEPDASVPLSAMKSADLKAVCDALGLKHGKVDEMRAAIADAAECKPEDVLMVDESGDEPAVVVIPAAAE